jgi:carbon storage regulator CsrA
MLILERKLGQQINVGKNIVITIVRIGANKVRMSFDCPDDLRIERAEKAKVPK